MDRLDRALWIVIAVLLTAVGALGIAAGSGHLYGVDPHTTTVLPQRWLDQWRAWGVWTLLGLCAAGLVMAWLGYRLLRAESRARGHRAAPAEFVLAPGRGEGPGEPPGEPRGKTALRGHALTGAAERALRRHPAIEGARVGFAGDIEHPQLHARIDMTFDAELQVVSEHVSRTLRQLTATSGLRFGAVDITVRPGRRAEPRVH